MHSLGKRTAPPCPVCQAASKNKHCKSPHCEWFCCIKCRPSVHHILVFNLRQRYFITGP